MGGDMAERWVEEMVRKLGKVAASLAKGKADASTRLKKEGEMIERSMRIEEKQEDISKKEKEEEETCKCTLSESTLCLLLDRFASY